MVPISPEIYSGAAVVMDNRSLFDYIQKLEDRRAKRALAEQEAADNYAKEIGKNLTPTGMKTNDIPHFIQLQQEIRQLSDKYRSTKNPLDKFALNNKADEALLFISESKAAVKEGEQPTSALGNVGNRNKVDFENLGRDLDLHNLPLIDPNRKKIGALSNYFYPEQFDEVGTFNEAAKGIKESELGTMVVKGQKIIPVGYGENAIRSIAENYLKLVDINPTATSYYKGKLKNLPAEKIVEAIGRVKKYYPKLEIDDDEPSFLKLSDAIEAAEKRTSQKIENAPKISVSTGGSGTSRQETIGNAFDEIDIENLVSGVKVAKDFTGSLTTKGDKLPQSIKSALSGIGYEIGDEDEDVDVKVENGQVVEIKALGKSPVSRSTMMNAQLKFSTEPAKGQQMVFGQQKTTAPKKKTGASSL